MENTKCCECGPWKLWWLNLQLVDEDEKKKTIYFQDLLKLAGFEPSNFKNVS
jgi:hypothetical protein